MRRQHSATWRRDVRSRTAPDAAERAVVLTGAGISVPSGIPDFRSPGTGLWENVDPMEVAHIDAWRRDPDRFWSFYGAALRVAARQAPNGAHRALAELERRGLVRAVITQNIDRLHRAAGTQRLIEVHGSIDRSVCLECGGTAALDERAGAARGDATGRRACDGCVRAAEARRGAVRRAAPGAAHGGGSGARAGADLMLCVGSSLEVYPVAGAARRSRWRPAGGWRSSPRGRRRTTARPR